MSDKRPTPQYVDPSNPYSDIKYPPAQPTPTDVERVRNFEIDNLVSLIWATCVDAHFHFDALPNDEDCGVDAAILAKEACANIKKLIEPAFQRVRDEMRERTDQRERAFDLMRDTIIDLRHKLEAAEKGRDETLEAAAQRVESFHYGDDWPEGSREIERLAVAIRALKGRALTPATKPLQDYPPDTKPIEVNMPMCDKCGKLFLDCKCGQIHVEPGRALTGKEERDADG